MSTFLIVGASFSSLRNYLEAAGHDYVVLLDKTRVGTRKYSANRILCDFGNLQSVIDAALSIQVKQEIDGVITVYENYILTAAKVAARLGVPGLPIDSANACTDKFLMRQAFVEAQEPISPDFAVVQNQQDVTDFANSHQFPLILKPANLAKSLLVTKNTNMDELLSNYQRTQEQIGKIYKKYAPNRVPKLLVEEFLEGSIHSIDAFVDSEGVPHVLEQVVDYQTGYDIGYDDNFHYSRILPSKLSETDKKALRHCAEVGCKALGMKNSPAHVEIILTDKGPRIVEIGARNGGYRDRMHALANGIDIIDNSLQIALGNRPSIKATRNDPCAVLELFPKQPGTFQGVNNEEILRKLPSLVSFNVKRTIGEPVGKAADGFKMCAVVVLHNSDTEQFNKDLAFVNKNVVVVTAAHA